MNAAMSRCRSDTRGRPVNRLVAGLHGCRHHRGLRSRQDDVGCGHRQRRRGGCGQRRGRAAVGRSRRALSWCQTRLGLRVWADRCADRFEDPLRDGWRSPGTPRDGAAAAA